MLKETLKGVLAGLAISLGGAVFLGCENKIAGAVLFSVALTAICYMGFSLYTGKIGFLAVKFGKRETTDVVCCLLGNFTGCIIFGLLLRAGMPELGEKASALCTAKLTQTAWSALVRAFFCGVLMYIAVWIFKNKNSIAGILLCVPAFILSGFEHSVADMFYFAAAGIFSPDWLLYVALIVAGNSIGGLIIPLTQRLISLTDKKEKDAEEDKNEQS